MKPFLDEFSRLEPEMWQPSWLLPLRKAGMARFAELGFPSTRDEDWRFTNIAPLEKLEGKSEKTAAAAAGGEE